MKKKFECIVRQFGDDFPAALIESNEPVSGDLFSGLPELSSKIGSRTTSEKSEYVLVAGKNFGHGHYDRDLIPKLKSSGTVVIIAESIARHFYREAINCGIAVIENTEIRQKFLDRESVSIDLENCEIKTAQNMIKINPIPDLLYKIYLSGGLISYTRRLIGK
jgi:3-isopropylmalate dehydratase small subunit